MHAHTRRTGIASGWISSNIMRALYLGVPICGCVCVCARALLSLSLSHVSRGSNFIQVFITSPFDFVRALVKGARIHGLLVE